MQYRDDEEFRDFIQYNDLGLPLAYASSVNLITLSKEAESLINETFEVFIAGLNVEDTGFEDLAELLALGESSKQD
jgi:hypothetical protein